MIYPMTKFLVHYIAQSRCFLKNGGIHTPPTPTLLGLRHKSSKIKNQEIQKIIISQYYMGYILKEGYWTPSPPPTMQQAHVVHVICYYTGGEEGSWQNVDHNFFGPFVYILHQNIAKNIHLQNILTKTMKIYNLYKTSNHCTNNSTIFMFLVYNLHIFWP